MLPFNLRRQTCVAPHAKQTICHSSAMLFIQIRKKNRTIGRFSGTARNKARSTPNSPCRHRFDRTANPHTSIPTSYPPLRPPCERPDRSPHRLSVNFDKLRTGFKIHFLFNTIRDSCGFIPAPANAAASCDKKRHIQTIFVNEGIAVIKKKAPPWRGFSAQPGLLTAGRGQILRRGTLAGPGDRASQRAVSRRHGDGYALTYAG